MEKAVLLSDGLKVNDNAQDREKQKGASAAFLTCINNRKKHCNRDSG